MILLFMPRPYGGNCANILAWVSPGQLSGMGSPALQKGYRGLKAYWTT